MSTTPDIDTSTSATILLSLAGAWKRNQSPLHVSAMLGAPGEIATEDGRTVFVRSAVGAMDSTLPGCWVLDVADSSGPIESYDLDSRGLTRRRLAA